MKWEDVRDSVAAVAPLAGSLLGGPAGGAVGGLVAAALGVKNTPDAVAQAVVSDPAAAVKLHTLEREHEREMRTLQLEAETARIKEVNTTMRAELQHDGWFKSGWRPMIGWVVAFSFGALMLALVYAILKSPATASEVVTSATVIITMMLAVLGVNIKQRSNDKARQVGVEPVGLLQAILGTRK